jgi:hypothetical protein
MSCHPVVVSVDAEQPADPPVSSPSAPGSGSGPDAAPGWATHACGALIAACVALPITPSGQSFLALLRGEFERGLLEGFMMVAGFGSPFLFGLSIAMVALPQLRGVANELVRTPIGLMHGQLLLVAFVVWRHGQSVGAAGLLGFAVIGAIAYARSGVRAPGGHRLMLRDTIRWGATVLAGVAAWCKLQRVADLRLGLAVDVVLVVAVALVLLSLRRRSAQQA